MVGIKEKMHEGIPSVEKRLLLGRFLTQVDHENFFEGGFRSDKVLSASNYLSTKIMLTL